MDFLELARIRRSVRAYKPDPIPDAVVRRVLEAAALAPTACNRQPFRILVLPTRGHEQDLARVYRHRWFTEGPLIIALVGVLSESWTRSDGVNYAFVDVAIAMDHLILAATEQGLGTCWVAAFNASAAREMLGLPNGVEPVAFSPLGYPNDLPEPKERRPIDDLVKWGRW